MLRLKRSKSSSALATLAHNGETNRNASPLSFNAHHAPPIASDSVPIPSSINRGRSKSISGKSTRTFKSTLSARSWRSASSERYRAFEGSVEDLGVFEAGELVPSLSVMLPFALSDSMWCIIGIVADGFYSSQTAQEILERCIKTSFVIPYIPPSFEFGCFLLYPYSYSYTITNTIIR